MKWWKRFALTRGYVDDLRMAVRERDAALHVMGSKLRMMEAVSAGVAGQIYSLQRQISERDRAIEALERELLRLSKTGSVA